MTIWRMRITCWIPKATYTHSEYVTLIAFPQQHWLHDVTLYVYCLSCYNSDWLCFLRGMSRIHNRKNRERQNVKLAIYEISITADCKPDAKIWKNCTILCMKTCKVTFDVLHSECVTFVQSSGTLQFTNSNSAKVHILTGMIKKKKRCI